MNMTQLREAFSTENVGWFQAVQMVRALRDPTPITESGLRELGYAPRTGTIWGLKNHPDIIGPIGGQIMLLFIHSELRVKSIGQLRGLLLFAGE